MINYELVGINISDARKKKRYTQEVLSELLNITPQYLSMIENGHRPANIELLVKISETLDVSIDFLLFGDQSADKRAYVEAFSELISDCDNAKKNVILKAAVSLKEILDNYGDMK